MYPFGVRGLDQSGMSITSVLIAGVLISFSALALSEILYWSRLSHGRTDKRVRGDDILIQNAARLQAMSFVHIRKLCLDRSAWNETRERTCLESNGKLSRGAALMPGVDPAIGGGKFIDVLLDWNGVPSTRGPVCIELRSCLEKVQGQIIEVTLQAYLPDPMDPSGQAPMLPPKTLAFRRAR